jgi:hypothetical protein
MTPPEVVGLLQPPDSRPQPNREVQFIATAPRRGLLGSAVQLVILLLLLSILAAVVLVLFAVASLVNVPGQMAGGLGGVTAEAGRAVSTAQQALQNVTDPNRPPTGLSYDNEFSALQVLPVGEPLPGGAEYKVSVQAIKRRDGASSADTAQYAVIHAELRKPRETRVFGQLIRSDPDAHDYVVYKGETFRIGRAVYRLNWLSQDENAIAVAIFRRPDSATSPLKFEYD